MKALYNSQASSSSNIGLLTDPKINKWHDYDYETILFAPNNSCSVSF